MGKSLYIQRRATRKHLDRRVIPIHGPEVKADVIIEALGAQSAGSGPNLIHLDVATTVR